MNEYWFNLKIETQNQCHVVIAQITVDLESKLILKQHLDIMNKSIFGVFIDEIRLYNTHNRHI